MDRGSFRKINAAAKKVFGYFEPLPILHPADYKAVSAEILAEIARVHRPIRARHSTTRRVIVESLHYDCCFESRSIGEGARMFARNVAMKRPRWRPSQNRNGPP